MEIRVLIPKIRDQIKREFINVYLAYKTKYVYNKRIARGSLMPKPECDYCELAVVTFNNSTVVEYQIRCLKKFFSYPYRYTVFDNSTNIQKSIEIEDICKRYNTGYIKLPMQEFLPKHMGSYSHGIACNYLYNNYLSSKTEGGGGGDIFWPA